MPCFLHQLTQYDNRVECAKCPQTWITQEKAEQDRMKDVETAILLFS